MTSQQLAQQTGIPRRAIDEIRALPMKYKLDRVIHLCFELSWKVMKEYLTEAGFSASSTGSSRTIIKTAYEAGLITDQEVWLSMLADRNDTSHEQDMDSAEMIIERTKNRYYPELKKRLDKFEAENKAAL